MAEPGLVGGWEDWAEPKEREGKQRAGKKGEKKAMFCLGAEALTWGNPAVLSYVTLENGIIANSWCM